MGSVVERKGSQAASLANCIEMLAFSSLIGRLHTQDKVDESFPRTITSTWCGGN